MKDPDECTLCRGVGYLGATGKKCPRCFGSGMKPIHDSIILNSDYPKPKYKDSLSIQLRTVRESRGVSLKDLAQKFNMTIPHLSDLELGNVKRTSSEEDMIKEWLSH